MFVVNGREVDWPMSLKTEFAGHSLACLLAIALIGAPASGSADPSAVTWEDKIEVASGGGYKGPWRMNKSEFRYVDDPTVAIDGEGFIGVAWADQLHLDIFFQVYGPNGTKRFEQPVNVSRSPETFSWLPRMVFASGAARDIYVLWQEIVFSGGSHGGEIYFARSSDGGKTFGDPLNLSNSTAGDGKGRLTERYWHNGSLDLAESVEGDLYAAWTEYQGNLWFSRSADRGKTFSEPLHIAGGGDAKPARGPALAVAANGTVHLAWTVGEDKTADIHIATSADRGRSFIAPFIAFESRGHSDAPKIAVDSRATLHLVYAESPAGPFDRYHIRYARSNDGARSFEQPRVLSGPLGEQYESAGFPSLAIDGEDNLYVLWDLFTSRKGYPRGLGFTLSSDRGESFAPPSVIPSSANPSLGINGSQQGLLMRKLAVNGAGLLAVVNSTFKKNQGSGIWLIRGRTARR